MKDIVEIVHEAIFKVTGCKDLKADGMYLSKELEQAIEALIERREKPMIEALEAAETIINHSEHPKAKEVLAKIDSILKEAQHE